MRAQTVLTLGCLTWFVVVVIKPVEPIILGWCALPVCSALAAVGCWRTSRSIDVPPVARRFWGWAAVAMAVFAASMVGRVFDSVEPDLTMRMDLSIYSAIGHAVAVILLVWPLLRLPLGTGSRAQRAALWLDIGAVMLASAVFLWHFSWRALFDMSPQYQTPTALTSGIALMGSGLAGVFVVAKVAFTGRVSLQPGALRALGAALAIGGLGSAFQPLLVTRLYVDTAAVVVPACSFLIALGARMQLVAGIRCTGVATRPRSRRYSLLPYVAVAATDALLLVAVMPSDSYRDRMVVTAIVVALTGVVVIRQITSFQDNDRLVTRLDAGLLELRRHERRFRSLVQNSSDVVTITDPGGTITYISPGVRRLLGHEPEALIGTRFCGAVHPDDVDAVRTRFEEVAANADATAIYQVRLAHVDGSWRWTEVISANLMHDPSVGGIVSNARDITEAREFQDRLTYEATHDGLTGLANRSLFGQRVGDSVTRSDPGHRISVVLIDLDDFKLVNDTLGHAVGDTLLVVVAERMRRSVRPGDTVARLGGDEFAILLDDLEPAEVEVIVERIIAALGEPVHVDGHDVTVQASFGIANGMVGDDAGNLLRHADIAMYAAKAEAGCAFQHFGQGMEPRSIEQSRLAIELTQALEAGELHLLYQPVVTLPHGRLTGVEALVRWQHPTRGPILPAQFIPVAERTGLIVPLGRWVLREACRQAAAWRAELGDLAPASISVNASARQLQEPDFAAHVAAALDDSGLEAGRLTIEITESTAVGGRSTPQTLHRLRQLGVRVALDDFGTGQSTLTLLATCPVDQIKLDRSFTPGPGSDLIATAVVQLARVLGIEAVAEGVERASQADRLRALGYEHAQGFHFARPVTADEITAVLRPGVQYEEAAA
jgi:diguanylate cyclase (GGDEF)-like protein/PAS domain S-box-containing protein